MADSCLRSKRQHVLAINFHRNYIIALYNYTMLVVAPTIAPVGAQEDYKVNTRSVN